jgi:polysaccharide biosynthesis/export protein
MCNKHLKFALLPLILLLASCGGGYASKTVSAPDLSVQKKTDILNESIMLRASSRPDQIEDSYLIGPDDLLEIEAYNVEELKKTVRVNSQGDIALPLIGIINVKGLTTSEVEQFITKKLDKYVEETVVTVYMKEYKSQRISVMGAVNKPQIFEITGQRYLLDMLMIAGGLSKDAGNICYVIRPSQKNSPNSRAETIVITLDELLENGNLSLNIPVFTGDVINVPKGGIIFVDGAVNSPGAFNMNGKITIIQAISMAKGTTSTASLGDVKIFRDSNKGEKEIITVDYEAIREGEKPDIQIAENDIIIVPVSGIKNFFSGFINTIRGFISFGAIPL